MEPFLPLLILLLLTAALLREDTVLVVFYLLAGIYLAGRWWSRSAVRQVQVERSLAGRAFFGQPVNVRLTLINRSWLPVVWLHLHESLPAELASPNFIRSVVTLGPRGKTQVNYQLRASKRGYYVIGPVFLGSGDLLGMSKESSRLGDTAALIVYPRIYTIQQLAFPSRSPFGTLRERRPIFEDPARVRGKRDYQSGDSRRRVDWKATAAAGKLQVKLYEPSMALEAFIVLDLDTANYEQNHWISSTELAITAAASTASWLQRNKQAVGLITNGCDPLASEEQAPHALPPRQGAGGLMQILDLLARIQPGGRRALTELIRQGSAGLTWGATVVVITSLFDETLLDELFQLRRRGLNTLITSVGPLPNQEEIHHRAARFGFPVTCLASESDLEVWQGTS